MSSRRDTAYSLLVDPKDRVTKYATKRVFCLIRWSGGSSDKEEEVNWAFLNQKKVVRDAIGYADGCISDVTTEIGYSMNIAHSVVHSLLFLNGLC